mmetsp:Transcript_12422/g.37369  ORF Transcript_12422/g.37369 Transcript_12422/m.37369 type:complete len:439 (-) Transcript_12422:393-1709(-)
MVVHHGGHAVEAIPVELVLVHPPPRVGHQEPQCLPVPVVETAGVPHPVVAAPAAVEVHGLSAVEHVDAVVGVLAGVAVHDVHQHHQPQPVSLVDHRLQLVRGAAPATGRKEVGDVVAEGTVVGVLLHRHDLDGVVAQRPDARQHVVLEVRVAVDLGLLAAHTHVALVDAQRTWPVRARPLEGVAFVRHQLAGGALLLGLVVHAVELDLIVLLGGPLDPGGDTLHPLSIRRLQPRLDLGLVLNGLAAVCAVRQEQLPHTEVIAYRPVVVLGVPRVEFAHQCDSPCAGGPLAVPDALHAVLLAAVEPVVLVPLAEFRQPALVLVDGVPHTLVRVPPVPEVVRVAAQGVIELHAFRAVVARHRLDVAVQLHERLPRVRLLGRPVVHRAGGGGAVLCLVRRVQLLRTGQTAMRCHTSVLIRRGRLASGVCGAGLLARGRRCS